MGNFFECNFDLRLKRFVPWELQSMTQVSLTQDSFNEMFIPIKEYIA
jgi:hypothetical protein